MAGLRLVERRRIRPGGQCADVRRDRRAPVAAPPSATAAARGLRRYRLMFGIRLVIFLTASSLVAEKLTSEQRVEILRGMMAEYATAKAYLPKSKKPLEYKSTGEFDKAEWQEIGKQLGPAARPGDLVQVTKVDIDDDKIVL